MENKKKMIVIVSILLIYLVIMIIVYGIDKVKNKFYHLDVLMSPNTYLKYENGKWKDEKETQTSMLGKTYKIYQNSNYLYDGVLQYTDEKWYAFDNNDKPLSLPEDFFAYRGNVNINIAEYAVTDMEINEIFEAEEILKDNGILFNPSYTKTLKIMYDLNNDGMSDTIYIISNTLGIEEQSLYFSIVYVKMNGNTRILVKDVSEDMYSVPSVNLKQILDYNKDKKYELIIGKTYFDQIGTCYEIFKIEKNAYESVKHCVLIESGDEEE